MRVLRIFLIAILGLAAVGGIFELFVDFNVSRLFGVIIPAGLAYFLYLPFKGQSKEVIAQQLEQQRQRQSYISTAVAAIRNGDKPSLPVQSVMLRDGEIAHYSEYGVLMENKITGYEAGSASVRVKVAKGVTIGTAGTKGKAVRDYVPVSDGELVITNARIVFAGKLKSFEIPFTKLTNFHAADSTLFFHVGSKPYIVGIDSDTLPIARCLLENMNVA